MLNRAINLLGYVLLFVFLVLVIYASVRNNDMMLLIIGLFFFGAGISAKSANDHFGMAIKQAKTYLDENTWTCHVCGDRRADDRISVATGKFKGLPGAEINIRYCNDRIECKKTAKAAAKRGEMP